MRKSIAAKPGVYGLNAAVNTTRKMLIAIIALSTLGMPAFAEDCHQYPWGPFRRECLDKKFPARIAQRQVCREQADQMNLTNLHGKKNKAKRNYVEGCMNRSRQKWGHKMR